ALENSGKTRAKTRWAGGRVTGHATRAPPRVRVCVGKSSPAHSGSSRPFRPTGEHAPCPHLCAPTRPRCSARPRLGWQQLLAYVFTLRTLWLISVTGLLYRLRYSSRVVRWDDSDCLLRC
uniref:Uncharacterized protein n=1 Tax=Coturnix japonica TaxID=93934 RepID=A0A8C2TZJ1_COTJA